MGREARVNRIGRKRLRAHSKSVLVKTASTVILENDILRAVFKYRMRIAFGVGMVLGLAAAVGVQWLVGH